MASPGHRLARELASRLRLRPLECRGRVPSVDAALAVAPVALRSYLAPTTPVVVLPRRAAAIRRHHGANVVCGVQDDNDAACVAIAGALADGLGLPLILVHVIPSVALAPVAFGAPAITAHIAASTVADRANGRGTLERVTRAAGLPPDGADARLMRGTPGPTIAATARREGSALVVVSASSRGRLQRALRGSATGYIVRHSSRPSSSARATPPRPCACAMRSRRFRTREPSAASNCGDEWGAPPNDLSLHRRKTADMAAAVGFLLVLGVALLVAELALSAHGVLATMGIVALIAGIVLAMFDAIGGVAVVLALIAPVIAGLGALALLALRLALAAGGKRARCGAEGLVGHIGVVRRPLDPLGHVAIDGELWHARRSWAVENTMLGEGESVVVDRVDGLTLSVRPAEVWEVEP
jgi:membrane protein implicated in regulation of membrane protease activity/nucleotide-binding universal stress UspA family protein